MRIFLMTCPTVTMISQQESWMIEGQSCCHFLYINSYQLLHKELHFLPSTRSTEVKPEDERGLVLNMQLLQLTMSFI